MTTRYNKRAVGLFPTRRDAERALHALRDAGFSMDRVSIVAQHSDSNDRLGGVEVGDRIADNQADQGATTGAAAGGALGAITGLLIGLGAISLPGLGPIILAGATATALATTLSGTAIGALAGGLIGALIGLGIPEDRAKVYSDRVSRGEYLVMLEGNENDLHHAQAILSREGIQEWGVYDMPESAQINEPVRSSTAADLETHPNQVATGNDQVVIIDRRDPR